MDRVEAVVLSLGDSRWWHKSATACASSDLLGWWRVCGGDSGTAGLRAGHSSSGKAEGIGLRRETCSRRSGRPGWSSRTRGTRLIDVPCTWNGRRDLRRGRMNVVAGIVVAVGAAAKKEGAREGSSDRRLGSLSSDGAVRRDRAEGRSERVEIAREGTTRSES